MDVFAVIAVKITERMYSYGELSGLERAAGHVSFHFGL